MDSSVLMVLQWLQTGRIKRPTVPNTKMKSSVLLAVGLFLSPLLYGQLSSTFEMRYFTKDGRANGETDFKGETEWMDTEERIVALNAYADYASRYFNNPQLDQAIVTDEEINALLNQ